MRLQALDEPVRGALAGGLNSAASIAIHTPAANGKPKANFVAGVPPCVVSAPPAMRNATVPLAKGELTQLFPTECSPRHYLANG
jgi:hypothetical protein